MTLAHLGHWYVTIFFAAPFLALVGLLTVGRLYERHRDRHDGGTTSPPGGTTSPPGGTTSPRGGTTSTT